MAADKRRIPRASALATAAARSAASSPSTSSNTNAVAKKHLKPRNVGPIATVSRDVEDELHQAVADGHEQEQAHAAETLALAFQFASPPTDQS